MSQYASVDDFNAAPALRHVLKSMFSGVTDPDQLKERYVQGMSTIVSAYGWTEDGTIQIETKKGKVETYPDGHWTSMRLSGVFHAADTGGSVLEVTRLERFSGAVAPAENLLEEGAWNAFKAETPPVMAMIFDHSKVDSGEYHERQRVAPVGEGIHAAL